MNLDAFVFDAYGTLFDVHSVMQRCESWWPGKGAALSQAWRTKQLDYTWQRSLMRRYAPFSQVTRDALEYACASLGLTLEAGKADVLMQDYLKLAVYPDVPAALADLRRTQANLSRKQAILSNGSPDMLLPLVSNNRLSFDAVISVDEVKIFKPAPEVYTLAVKKLGVPKERIGFVSSNCWDALGAKSFGFTVYWINRTGAPLERLGFTPDGVLKSLGNLPEVLL